MRHLVEPVQKYFCPEMAFYRQQPGTSKSKWTSKENVCVFVLLFENYLIFCLYRNNKRETSPYSVIMDPKMGFCLSMRQNNWFMHLYWADSTSILIKSLNFALNSFLIIITVILLSQFPILCFLSFWRIYIIDTKS